MEKDFSKAISNNEKKKKRNSRFYCPIWNPSISFEIELKIVSFTFETRNFSILREQEFPRSLSSPTETLLLSIARRGWFSRNSNRRISGSRDFHSVFFNFHQEGGGRKVVFPTHQPASVHTYAPIGYSVRDPIEKSIP